MAIQNPRTNALWLSSKLAASTRTPHHCYLAAAVHVRFAHDTWTKILTNDGRIASSAKPCDKSHVHACKGGRRKVSAPTRTRENSATQSRHASVGPDAHQGRKEKSDDSVDKQRRAAPQRLVPEYKDVIEVLKDTLPRETRYDPCAHRSEVPCRARRGTDPRILEKRYPHGPKSEFLHAAAQVTPSSSHPLHAPPHPLHAPPRQPFPPHPDETILVIFEMIVDCVSATTQRLDSRA